jgi:hypothetical protein
MPRICITLIPAIFVMTLAGCAPASLARPPADEHSRQCLINEVRVCRSRNPTRLGKEEDQEFDFCTCELLERGIH